MAEYVRMPKAHYEAACNSIRAKTGKTDLITSGAMSAEIDGITGGGGGSVDGYATVTFMNGADVLFSRMVLKGDDCPDPYVQNRIELPTKESTAQYTYTFNGWATADGGSANANALKGITEDKTLYAAYTSAVRYYTISFYDGDTLVHTEQVAYGGSSGYIHYKDDLMFKYWTPEPTNITGDTACYGVWVEKPAFSTMSWADIAAICESGEAANTFSVGDEKDITVTYEDGTSEVVTLQIAGFNVSNLNGKTASSSDVVTAPITLVSKRVLKDLRQQHSSSRTSFSSNAQSDLRKWLNTTFLNALPTDFKNLLKTQHIGLMCTPKIAIPYMTNIAGSRANASSGNTTVTAEMSYSVQFPLFETEANRIRYGADGTAQPYWLVECQIRSNYTDYDGSYVTASGSLAVGQFTSSYGVVPVFAI